LRGSDEAFLHAKNIVFHEVLGFQDICSLEKFKLHIFV